MPTTSNFGWTTPADTDLVKDGAAAIRTLGNGIDTSLVDLKGGTTNQVLAKNSNTDLDFKWVADATGIPATIFDAKGDIIAATAADTADRLAVGANGTVLTADSTTSTGLKWATITSGANFSLLNTGGTSLSGSSSVTISGITAADKILVVVDSAAAGNNFFCQLEINSTNTNYFAATQTVTRTATYGNSTVGATYYTDRIPLAEGSSAAGSQVQAYCLILGGNSAGVKVFQGAGSANANASTDQGLKITGGTWTNSSTISSIRIVSSVGNFTNGTIYVYTSA